MILSKEEQVDRITWHWVIVQFLYLEASSEFWVPVYKVRICELFQTLFTNNTSP